MILMRYMYTACAGAFGGEYYIIFCYCYSVVFGSLYRWQNCLQVGNELMVYNIVQCSLGRFS